MQFISIVMWWFPLLLGINVTTVIIPVVLLTLLVAGMGIFAALRRYVTSHFLILL